MVWHRAGDKPLPEAMMTRFTNEYICIFRSQWVIILPSCTILISSCTSWIYLNVTWFAMKIMFETFLICQFSHFFFFIWIMLTMIRLWFNFLCQFRNISNHFYDCWCHMAWASEILINTGSGNGSLTASNLNQWWLIINEAPWHSSEGIIIISQHTNESDFSGTNVLTSQIKILFHTAWLKDVI